MEERIHKDFGRLIFRHSTSARRLSARIEADGIRVGLPRGVTPDVAVKWLEANRAALLRKQASMRGRRWQFEEGKPRVMFPFTMEVRRAARNDFFLELKDGRFTVHVPEKMEVADERVQRVCREGLAKAFRHEAKRLIPPMVREEARRADIGFETCAVSSAKGRWGSCSSGGRIMISMYVMLLPEHLIRYVIRHELCHRRYMNHGKDFYALLDKLCDGRHALWQKEMKAYSPAAF